MPPLCILFKGRFFNTRYASQTFGDFAVTVLLFICGSPSKKAEETRKTEVQFCKKVTECDGEKAQACGANQNDLAAVFSFLRERAKTPFLHHVYAFCAQKYAKNACFFVYCSPCSFSAFSVILSMA